MISNTYCSNNSPNSLIKLCCWVRVSFMLFLSFFLFFFPLSRKKKQQKNSQSLLSWFYEQHRGHANENPLKHSHLQQTIYTAAIFPVVSFNCSFYICAIYSYRESYHCSWLKDKTKQNKNQYILNLHYSRIYIEAAFFPPLNVEKQLFCGTLHPPLTLPRYF